MKPLFAFLAILLFSSVMAGCGESEQVVHYKQGKYSGKPDSQPWSNAPLVQEFRGGSWKKDDRASWEEQIKQRQLAQHEHRRIYQ